jgi:hypothetical protein
VPIQKIRRLPFPLANTLDLSRHRSAVVTGRAPAGLALAPAAIVKTCALCSAAGADHAPPAPAEQQTAAMQSLPAHVAAGEGPLVREGSGLMTRRAWENDETYQPAGEGEPGGQAVGGLGRPDFGMHRTQVTAGPQLQAVMTLPTQPCP